MLFHQTSNLSSLIIHPANKFQKLLQFTLFTPRRCRAKAPAEPRQMRWPIPKCRRWIRKPQPSSQSVPYTCLPRKTRRTTFAHLALRLLLEVKEAHLISLQEISCKEVKCTCFSLTAAIWPMVLASDSSPFAATISSSSTFWNWLIILPASGQVKVTFSCPRGAVNQKILVRWNSQPPTKHQRCCAPTDPTAFKTWTWGKPASWTEGISPIQLPGCPHVQVLNVNDTSWSPAERSEITHHIMAIIAMVSLLPWSRSKSSRSTLEAKVLSHVCLTLICIHTLDGSSPYCPTFLMLRDWRATHKAA